MQNAQKLKCAGFLSSGGENKPRPRSKIARIGAVEAVINTHLSVTNRSVEGFLFTAVVNRERFSTSLLFFVVHVLLISGPKQ